MRSASMSLSLEGFLLVAQRTRLDSRPLLGLCTVVKTFMRKACGKLICSTTPWLNCSPGLSVRERNYLDVYPYDKWSDKELPDFEEGATFVPSVCELRDGTTSKPSLLTEADLVGIMDKNGNDQKTVPVAMECAGCLATPVMQPVFLSFGVNVCFVVKINHENLSRHPVPPGLFFPCAGRNRRAFWDGADSWWRIHNGHG